jgi:hypothetical protein
MAVGMSEHYFGDSANGNLATATAMERPQELTLAAYQLALKLALTAVYTRVLAAQAQPADGLDVITPPILNVDKAQLLTALTSVGTSFPAMNQEFLWREILKTIGVQDVDAAIGAIAALPTPPAVPPSGAFLTALAGLPGQVPAMNQPFLWKQILITAGVPDVDTAIQAMLQHQAAAAAGPAPGLPNPLLQGDPAR